MNCIFWFIDSLWKRVKATNIWLAWITNLIWLTDTHIYTGLARLKRKTTVSGYDTDTWHEEYNEILGFNKPKLKIWLTTETDIEARSHMCTMTGRLEKRIPGWGIDWIMSQRTTDTTLISPELKPTTLKPTHKTTRYKTLARAPGLRFKMVESPWTYCTLLEFARQSSIRWCMNLKRLIWIMMTDQSTNIEDD